MLVGAEHTQRNEPSKSWINAAREDFIDLKITDGLQENWINAGEISREFDVQ